LRHVASLVVLDEGAVCSRRLRPHRIKVKGSGGYDRAQLDR
jgi:hypothetical protein